MINSTNLEQYPHEVGIHIVRPSTGDSVNRSPPETKQTKVHITQNDHTNYVPKSGAKLQKN